MFNEFLGDEVVDRERVPAAARASASATARSTKASRPRKWPFSWIKPDFLSFQTILFITKKSTDPKFQFFPFVSSLPSRAYTRMDSELLFQLLYISTLFYQTAYFRDKKYQTSCLYYVLISYTLLALLFLSSIWCQISFIYSCYTASAIFILLVNTIHLSLYLTSVIFW